MNVAKDQRRKTSCFVVGFKCVYALVVSVSMVGCSESGESEAQDSDVTRGSVRLIKEADEPRNELKERREQVPLASPAAEVSRKDVKVAKKSTIDEAESPPPNPFDPPLTAVDVDNILQQCLCHLLTAPDMEHTTEFYGTPGSPEVVLMNGWEQDWPVDFKPNVKGYDVRFEQADAAPPDGNRILGIQLDKLDVTAPVTGAFGGNIALTVLNVGGSENGGVIGRCYIYYAVQRQSDAYVVKFSGSFDP